MVILCPSPANQVICYVYFTRVVAYLLAVTVPFSLTWTVEFFKESVTFLFFVAVGYKFRPVDNNPYLLIHADDDDENEDTVMERIQMEEVYVSCPTWSCVEWTAVSVGCHACIRSWVSVCREEKMHKIKQ